MIEVAPMDLRRVVQVLQPLDRKCSNRLEHPEASAGACDQALIGQGGKRVEVGVDHVLGGVERPSTSKYREASEEALLVIGQKVMAPFDRRAQRCLPRVGIATAPEQI